MSIIYTLIIFSVIIFIHELGHFVVARLCGVRVIEFSLGMGPAIFKYQGKETLYALRILPIGGYAAMEGENGEFGEYEKSKLKEIADVADENDDNNHNTENTDTVNIIVEELNDETSEIDDIVEFETEKPKSSRAFSEKSVIQRILICVAGPVMNLVLAYFLFVSILFNASGIGTTTIAQFKEDSNTNLTGLRVGDTITKINGVSIATDMDIIYEVLRDYDKDGIFDMQVIRDGNKLNLNGVTFNLVEPEPDENGEIDPNATTSIFFDFYVKSDIELTTAKILKRAFSETYSLSRSSIFSVVDLFTGRVAFSELSGPVGVGQVVGQAAKISLDSVLNLAAMISISIGIFNLLPFPALDGGRIVLYVIEGVRGKPVDTKIEGYINATGMLILLTLMIAVTFKDIINLF